LLRENSQSEVLPLKFWHWNGVRERRSRMVCRLPHRAPTGLGSCGFLGSADTCGRPCRARVPYGLAKCQRPSCQNQWPRGRDARLDSGSTRAGVSTGTLPMRLQAELIADYVAMW